MKLKRISGIIYILLLTRIIIEILVLILISRSVSISIFVYALVTLPLVYILFSLFMLAKRRWPLIVLYFLTSVYLFSQINYFFYYNIPMDFFGVLTVAGDGITAFFHGSNTLRLELFLPFIDLPVFILVCIFYPSCREKILDFRWKKQFISISLLVFTAYHGFTMLMEKSEIISKSRASLVSRHGTFLYSALKPVIYSNPMLIATSEVLDNSIIYKNHEDKIVKITNSPDYGLKKWITQQDEAVNFLFIQVESMQSGLERIKHNNEFVMPYMNELAKNSIYYPYCFAYHTAGGTSDCEISIFNNIEPVNGKRMTSSGFQHENSFIKVVKNFNYTPLTFHNYEKKFFSRGDSYPRIGFNKFYDYYDMEMTGRVWGSQDGQMFSFINRNNKQWTEPFLFYSITLSSHPGFGHITEYHNVDFLEDIKRKRDRDALISFNYIDQELSKFIPEFRKLFPNTYIIIFGDHSLGTVYYAGHLERSAVTVNEDYLEFAPAFILTPDNQTAVNDDILLSFHDFGPTVLSLMPEVKKEAGAKKEPDNIVSYTAFGGSIFYDDYAVMDIPFNNSMYNRDELLSAIKRVIEPYFEPDE